MSTAGELRQKDALDRARQSPACKRGLATFSFARVARQPSLAKRASAPPHSPSWLASTPRRGIQSSMLCSTLVPSGYKRCVDKSNASFSENHFALARLALSFRLIPSHTFLTNIVMTGFPFRFTSYKLPPPQSLKNTYYNVCNQPMMLFVFISSQSTRKAQGPLPLPPRPQEEGSPRLLRLQALLVDDP